jgi:quercetin dioxygenase-like cupin family protein
MRKIYFSLTAILAMTVGIAYAATMAAPTVFTPATTHWVAGTGLEKGTYNAVLAGDPTKAGFYVVRSKLPAGTAFPAHYHNERENVTVISGTLWVGVGDKMNKAKMKPLGPGSFVVVPAKLHHYAMTKVDTVIQIEGIGPETMIAVKKP